MTMNAPMILKLDIQGRPIAWLSWQSATVLHVKDKIAWEMGDEKIHIYGGINRISGKRSVITLDTIIATRDHHATRLESLTPILSNKTLFARDQYTCLYCGEIFPNIALSRDHVIPLTKGGPNTWTNVVTACKRCNHQKAAKTLKEAKMKLLGVPYEPNHAEHLLLSNRKILADQMLFLKKQITQQGKSRYQ